MALNKLLNDKIPSASPAQTSLTQEVVISLLREDAIRGEVYDTARFMTGASESFNIVDVHNVLDALIASLEGGADGD